jgi:hypothetical protein
MQAYLDKFPPTWDADVRYDPTRLALQVLDECIPIMEADIDGPLEYLRYSYRIYPFDRAFERAWRILPPRDGVKLYEYHEAQLPLIHDAWAIASAATITLDDYRTTMHAHREGLIKSLRESRERIRAHGLVHAGEQYIRQYGDTSATP